MTTVSLRPHPADLLPRPGYDRSGPGSSRREALRTNHGAAPVLLTPIYVNCAAVEPTGQGIALGLNDGSISYLPLQEYEARNYDSTRATTILSFEDDDLRSTPGVVHEKAVTAVCWSGDQVYSSDGRTLKLWSQTGQCLRTWKTAEFSGETLQSLELLDNRICLVQAGNQSGVILWRWCLDTDLPLPDFRAEHVALHPRRPWAVSCDAQGLSLLELTDSLQIPESTLLEGIEPLAVDADIAVCRHKVQSWPDRRALGTILPGRKTWIDRKRDRIVSLESSLATIRHEIYADRKGESGAVLQLLTNPDSTYRNGTYQNGKFYLTLPSGSLGEFADDGAPLREFDLQHAADILSANQFLLAPAHKVIYGWTEPEGHLFSWPLNAVAGYACGRGELVAYFTSDLTQIAIYRANPQEMTEVARLPLNHSPQGHQVQARFLDENHLAICCDQQLSLFRFHPEVSELANWSSGLQLRDLATDGKTLLVSATDHKARIFSIHLNSD